MSLIKTLQWFFYSQKSWICETAYIPQMLMYWYIFNLLSYPLYLVSSSYTSLFFFFYSSNSLGTFAFWDFSPMFSLPLSLLHKISTLFSLISLGLFATFPVKPSWSLYLKLYPLTLYDFCHRNCHHLTAVHLTYFFSRYH